MCGSRPLPDAVTRSTGTGAGLPGSAARSASIRCLTALTSAGFVGPRLDPLDAVELLANGAVADGRLQKYFGSANGCPISSEPSALPPRSMMLPLAASWNRNCAVPVTSIGYTTPQSIVIAASIEIDWRTILPMVTPSDEAKRDEQHVDDLDAEERHGDSADPVDQQVPAQQRSGTERAVAHALERKRNQKNDDQRVEDHG